MGYNGCIGLQSGGLWGLVNCKEVEKLSAKAMEVIMYVVMIILIGSMIPEVLIIIGNGQVSGKGLFQGWKDYTKKLLLITDERKWKNT